MSDTREQTAAWLNWLVNDSCDLRMMADTIFAGERGDRTRMLLDTCTDIISLGLKALRDRDVERG